MGCQQGHNGGNCKKTKEGQVRKKIKEIVVIGAMYRYIEEDKL